MTIKYYFSLELLHARERRRLTQEQASELFDISKRWYQMIEKGEYLPSSELLLRMVAEFEIDGKRLKEGDNFPPASLSGLEEAEGA